MTAELAPMWSAVLRYAWAALGATLFELALLLGPALVLAWALHALGDLVTRRTTRHLGGAAYAIFGWPGTVVHELGHAFFCLLFGHRITGVKLFDFAPHDGTRGHVAHTFDPTNPWQQVGNFFIGVGPILFGTLAIVAVARWRLGLGTGVLVANSIPAADERPAGAYEPAFAGALDEAAKQGIRGRTVTPFLLEQLRERTGGATVTANLALLRHNASVAARLARALGRRG